MFAADDIIEIGDEIEPNLFELKFNGLPQRFAVGTLIVFLNDKWRKIFTVEPVKIKLVLED